MRLTGQESCFAARREKKEMNILSTELTFIASIMNLYDVHALMCSFHSGAYVGDQGRVGKKQY